MQTTDTACSTALIAIITACEQLRNGNCDMAIAGAVGVEPKFMTVRLNHPIHVVEPFFICLNLMVQEMLTKTIT